MRRLLSGDLPGTEGTDFHQRDPVGQALILALELDARTSQRRGQQPRHIRGSDMFLVSFGRLNNPVGPFLGRGPAGGRSDMVRQTL